MKVFSQVLGAVSALMLLSVGFWAAARFGLIRSLFSARFLAHQYCYLRQPELIWSNAVADGLIWLSYLTIAAGLLALLWRTRDYLLFHWVFVAFGLFIVACGFTHFFEMVTVWNPLYWMSTSVKALTAVASVATAIAFVPLVPRAAKAIRLFHEAYASSEKERVEALSRLLDTEERMKLAVESAELAIWEHNLLTRESIVDERCRAIFGLPTRKSVKYEELLDRLHPEDREQTRSLLDDALNTRREYNTRFRVVRDDGTIRTVLSRGKVFSDAQGHPARLIGTLIDVTRERQAEEALLKAEKLAVAGRMAASIAHEINNPLGAAIALLYATQSEDQVPQHVKSNLALAEHELNRAAQITRSTLTFYRESPHPVSTDVVELMRTVLKLQQPAIRRAGIEVDADLVQSGPIYAYPGELQQVLTNLISNAIDALHGSGRLILRGHPAREWRGNRKGYRILVADNGGGIPADVGRSLFTAFYTTKGEKGTGLGLWITHQLLERSGGSIRFRSRVRTPQREGGTVFSVWLPLTMETAGQMAS